MATPPNLSIGQMVSFNGEACTVSEIRSFGRNNARRFVIENCNTRRQQLVFKHQLDLYQDSDDEWLMEVDMPVEVANEKDKKEDIRQVGLSRFARVGDDKLQQLARARNEKTTDASTKWAVKIFRDWLIGNDFEVEFERKPVEELNHLFRKFYAEVRTKTGKEYCKATLNSLRAGINRHLTSSPFDRQINIMQDKAFMSANHVFSGLIKEMKRSGKDFTKHHESISQGDIQKMYTSGTLSNESPVSLVRKVWFEIALHFGRRGGEGLRALRGDSFVIARDDVGIEYFRMSYNEVDKTHHGLDKREQDKQPRMYATNDQNCPVKSLKLYLEKRNTSTNDFFQRPLTNSSMASDCWYSKQPMGVTSLRLIMSTISRVAKLSQKYTNHCVRATVATKLSEAGVGPLGIMSITGHRNEQSLKSYINAPSVAQRRAFSNILQSENLPFSDSRIPPFALADNSVPQQVTSVSTVMASSSLTGHGSSTQSVATYESTGMSLPFHGAQILNSANITGGNITINIYDSKRMLTTD